MIESSSYVKLSSAHVAAAANLKIAAIELDRAKRQSDILARELRDRAEINECVRKWLWWLPIPRYETGAAKVAEILGKESDAYAWAQSSHWSIARDCRRIIRMCELSSEVWLSDSHVHAVFGELPE